MDKPLKGRGGGTTFPSLSFVIKREESGVLFSALFLLCCTMIGMITTTTLVNKSLALIFSR